MVSFLCCDIFVILVLELPVSDRFFVLCSLINKINENLQFYGATQLC